MTEQIEISATDKSSSRRGSFYVIRPDIRGGGKGHGLRIANEDRLWAPGWAVMLPPDGNPDQYPEKPQLVHIPKFGRMPRDVEIFSGIWIVSELAKKIFESIDPEGFAFTACDFTLANGSHGDQHYLCNVIRVLDALDEEASKLKITVNDDYVNGKYYDRSGGATLIFKKNIVGAAHVFRTPFALTVFCDRVFRDAIRAAKLTGVWLTDTADC
jgi:hypothetical protein